MQSQHPFAAGERVAQDQFVSHWFRFFQELLNCLQRVPTSVANAQVEHTGL